MKKVKAWLSKDETVGYSLWIKEPYIVILYKTGKTLYVNFDNITEIYSRPLQDIDLEIDNFPYLTINTMMPLELPESIIDYYFKYLYEKN